MIETLANATEIISKMPEHNSRVNAFDPDKRMEVKGDVDRIENSKAYNPDERIETSPNSMSGELEGNIGSADNPRNMITRNENLEGEVHPITGVPFERMVVQRPDGEHIEGVFPKFDSMFDANIPENLYKESDKAQFQECNKQLLEAINTTPELKEKFSSEQIEQIKEGVYEGTAPDGYVWHHDVESGKLQLVDAEIHAKTGHTGGRYLWGGGTENR